MEIFYMKIYLMKGIWMAERLTIKKFCSFDKDFDL